MPDHSSIGDRMKRYEGITDVHLIPRMPVIIRLDMRAGHTFTRGFKRPFDEVFTTSMQETMKYLCSNIMNIKFGYCQSDEITLVMIDYETLETQTFFDNRIQKICSIAASMATLKFNRVFNDKVANKILDYKLSFAPQDLDLQVEVENYHSSLKKAVERGATFDARCFNIPKEEVCNNILWRQQDATRNSILSVGQANFSHKELQGKSCNEIQDMLMLQKRINWNDIPTYLKRGTACRKVERTEIRDSGLEDVFGTGIDKRVVGVLSWELDLDMPILKGEGRKYVDDLVYIGE